MLPAYRPDPRNTALTIANTANQFSDDDNLCIDQLATLLQVRFPAVSWTELEADGQPFALISQGAGHRGGVLTMTVERMAVGAAWRVVCDGVTLVSDAVSAARAALEAGLEVGLQMALGVA
jgi:hypothetical protein